MSLDITFDDGINSELQAAAPGWLQETVDWLLQQEQPPKPREPFYEVKKFRIGLLGWNKGLQNRRTGEGWDYLQLTQFLAVADARPTYQLYDG